jgi:hypothetical protein
MPREELDKTSKKELDKVSKEGITKTLDEDKTQVDPSRNRQADSGGNQQVDSGGNQDQAIDQEKLNSQDDDVIGPQASKDDPLPNLPTPDQPIPLGAHITSIRQPKASFDLPFAAQFSAIAWKKEHPSQRAYTTFFTDRRYRQQYQNPPPAPPFRPPVSQKAV